MIHFQLVSTKGTKFDDDAYEVLVPTKDGTIALFEDHMPLISAGAAGVISVRKEANDSDEHMEEFAVSGGVVQVDGKTEFLRNQANTILRYFQGEDTSKPASSTATVSFSSRER